MPGEISNTCSDFGDCLFWNINAEGLRAVDQGVPSINQMLADHADYCAVLASAGANLITLLALPPFPDAHFVEDMALCLPEGVIFM